MAVGSCNSGATGAGRRAPGFARLVTDTLKMNQIFENVASMPVHHHNHVFLQEFV